MNNSMTTIKAANKNENKMENHTIQHKATNKIKQNCENKLKCKLKQQDGYLLLFSLFFLACALLCTSILALCLSDGLAASRQTVQKEQSRQLAYSGWNLAIAQLEQFGTADALHHTPPYGAMEITMTESSAYPAAWEITALGRVGNVHRCASGTVQCIAFPFADTHTWEIVSDAFSADTPAILLSQSAQYHLAESHGDALGITALDGSPLCVTVTDAITTEALYIYGDLVVAEDAALIADAIYVSGSILGAEQIQCMQMYSDYTDAPTYQTRVLERSVT